MLTAESKTGNPILPLPKSHTEIHFQVFVFISVTNFIKKDSYD